MTDTHNFGRTPGYWKNHTEVWDELSYGGPIEPTDSFSDLFGAGPDVSLLDALGLKGGGVDALARHATAAFLNASVDNEIPKNDIPENNFLLWQYDDVLFATKVTILDGDKDNIEDLKNIYDFFNNLNGYEQVGPQHDAGGIYKEGFFYDIFVEYNLLGTTGSDEERFADGLDNFLDQADATQWTQINAYIDPL